MHNWDSSSGNAYLEGVAVEGIAFTDYVANEFYYSSNDGEVDDTIVNLFTEAEQRFSGNIGNSVNDIHFYDTGTQSPGSDSDVYIRDYDSSGSYGTNSAILFDTYGGGRQAYNVVQGFWSYYAGTCGGPNGNCGVNNVANCGPPINEEYSQGNGTSRQDFKYCYLYWDGSSTSAHTWPVVAPGWMDGGYWDSTRSYAFAEAYERNGARNTVGEPMSSVHTHGSGDNTIEVQDFDTGIYGWCSVVHNPEDNNAHLIRNGFKNYYDDMSGEASFGYPCEDENDFGNYSYQEFEKATLYWYDNSATHFEKDPGSHYCTGSGINSTVPSDGELIRGSSSDDVYMVDSGHKKWILTTELFGACGYDWDDVVDYPQHIVENVPSGSNWNFARCLPEDIVITGDQEDPIYYLEGGYKRWITHMDIYHGCGYNLGDLIVYSQSLVDGIPESDVYVCQEPADGEVFGSDYDDDVFVMDSGHKKWIPSTELFGACGYDWNDVPIYPQSMVDGIPSGSNWNFARCLPEDIVITGNQQDEIYYLEGGYKRWITHMDIYHGCGYNLGDLLEYSQSLVDGIPEADVYSCTWPANGVLFKTLYSDDIFMMQDGVKHWIPYVELYNACGYSWDDYLIYSQQTVDSIPQGNNWNLADCLPGGTLVHDEGNDKIYYTQNGAARHILNEDVYLSCGFSWDDYVSYSHALAEGMPSGPDYSCTEEDNDYDQDGYWWSDADCNDEDPAINPGAYEDCWDGVDNDCDWLTDSEDPDCDADNDGDGYWISSGDCNDGDASIHPGAIASAYPDGFWQEGNSGELCWNSWDGSNWGCIPPGYHNRWDMWWYLPHEGQQALDCACDGNIDGSSGCWAETASSLAYTNCWSGSGIYITYDPAYLPSCS